MLYQRLTISLRPPDSRNLVHELEHYQKDLASVRSGSSGDPDADARKPEIIELSQLVGAYQYMADFAYLLVVPPGNPEASRNTGKAWVPVSRIRSGRAGLIQP